ncbi:hypothetical protein [Sutcliffiella horikoshii]|uniref:hypothetical protein n=1 Tax=Sutcliffiella horikoshii TaxID=79883 RepID=UPI001F2A8F36|nr:hypothetical protein [Sutcliffiella horikoshii]MCG1020910.1 hypothetical protein [Sutcliffiella horikoshii]
MYLFRIVLPVAIFLMTVFFNLDHSTPNSILANYEKSFYFELENAPLDKNPDDESITGIVSDGINDKNSLTLLIPEQSIIKLNFHLVTVFYQGSYI